MEENELILETPLIEVADYEVLELEMSEAFPATDTADSLNHALLNNREIHDAHPITAITGLREELDSIEALQTIYSDKKGNADYYEWADGNYGADDRTGLFVTLDNEVRTISICTGDDIFGIVVDGAGFVGGQDKIARDVRYGLVATTGAVHVRCELDVADGDYVVSNRYGVARKSNSNRGYKVVARHNIDGIPHATIKLNISADQVDSMGVELQKLGYRMDTAETNIVSAINVANEAYKKSTEVATSSSVSEEAVRKALESILDAEQKIEDFEQAVESTSVAAAQAKAMAESAVTSATSMKDEAVQVANDAWKDVSDLTKTLEPITTWKDPKTGTTGANYLATQMTNGIATTYDIQTVDEKTEKAMGAIIRNGKELQSLMTVIDKYSVGPYSQAYSFTLEQATSILEEGMIYVPTSHEKFDAGTKYHEEEYSYTDENGDVQNITRSFVPGYLYRWGQLDNGLYGWITIDEDYSEEKLNTSVPSVYFSSTEPAVSGSFGYWYTDSDTVPDGYNSYTLYKWEKPDSEDGYWFAVATLAGNFLSRATSQIRQTANSIETDVTNVKGDLAGIKIWAGDDFMAIQDAVKWKNNGATIKRVADDDGSSIVLTAYSEDDATGTLTEQASLVLNVIKDDNGNPTSGLAIGADNIDLNGVVTANSYFKIDENGRVIAKQGEIGGWILDANSLSTEVPNYDNTSNFEIKIAAPSSYSDDVISVRGDQYGNDITRFRVSGDGSIFAREIALGSGSIGSDSAVYLGTSNGIGANTFFPDDNGNARQNWRLAVGEHFGVTSDGSLYASRGDFGGLKINDLSLTIDNAETGGYLHLYHTGTPRLSVFTEVNNQAYGALYDASGVTIQKWSTNDFSGGGWLTLYNNNTVYSLYLDHTDNTVKFMKTDLLLTFYINDYKLQSTTSQSMTWQEWVDSKDNSNANFTTLCINGNERYLGISGAPSRIRLKRADGTLVVATDAIISGHKYTF